MGLPDLSLFCGGLLAWVANMIPIRVVVVYFYGVGPLNSCRAVVFVAVTGGKQRVGILARALAKADRARDIVWAMCFFRGVFGFGLIGVMFGLVWFYYGVCLVFGWFGCVLFVVGWLFWLVVLE